MCQILAQHNVIADVHLDGASSQNEPKRVLRAMGLRAASGGRPFFSQPGTPASAVKPRTWHSAARRPYRRGIVCPCGLRRAPLPRLRLS